MLVLSDADGAGIDLYQLCQRILQAPGDGCRASLPHIKLREFFCGQFAGRINAGSGLTDYHILYRFRDFP